MVEFLSVIEYDVGSNPIVLVSSTDISLPFKSIGFIGTLEQVNHYD
jgi:hypothetical protein